MADDFAKATADCAIYATDQQCLGEADLAHLTRKTTEKRSKVTRDWFFQHVKRERRYRPREKAKPDPIYGRKERS